MQHMNNMNMYPTAVSPSQMNMPSMPQPMQVMVVEPFVYQALMSLKGKRVVLDTTRGPVNGIVVDAKPDHVVIQERDSTFFVRTCEIIWIMPETGK
ncbi:YuzF family protein [Bacillus sp. HMF5848]|uniref:YuzF family protein n=1 Tax=Bacillus sp. HMF5848 TaxID=2495421 RepID=UPI0021AE0371|nr:YuzF family protein [Bacillus sp. HMF5848]